MSRECLIAICEMNLGGIRPELFRRRYDAPEKLHDPALVRIIDALVGKLDPASLVEEERREMTALETAWKSELGNEVANAIVHERFWRAKRELTVAEMKERRGDGDFELSIINVQSNTYKSLPFRHFVDEDELLERPLPPTAKFSYDYDEDAWDEEAGAAAIAEAIAEGAKKTSVPPPAKPSPPPPKPSSSAPPPPQQQPPQEASSSATRRGARPP